MSTQAVEESRLNGMGAVQRRRVLAWAVLAMLAALLGWFGFRGYLNPELLFLFANALHC
jgi:hypothetical protein